MGDGVISVDAERDEDVGGAVRDEALHEADGLAGEDARLPAHRDLPDDVRGDWQQAHRQVCTWYREGSRGKEKNQFGELNCSKYLFITEIRKTSRAVTEDLLAETGLSLKEQCHEIFELKCFKMKLHPGY